MADDPLPNKPKSIHRVQIGVNVIVQVAILIVLAAMVNYLGFEHYRRWDLSRDQKYALSDKTSSSLPASRARHGSPFSLGHRIRLRMTCRTC